MPAGAHPDQDLGMDVPGHITEVDRNSAEDTVAVTLVTLTGDALDHPVPASDRNLIPRPVTA